MWRNREVLDFIEWLRRYNLSIDDPQQRVAFYGLDLYSVFTSIRAVLDYLDGVDPEAARIARLRYGCLTPGRAIRRCTAGWPSAGDIGSARTRPWRCSPTCSSSGCSTPQYDGARFLDAVQNARLVANAERYYRIMYYGSNESWNHRDWHMFDTLELLLGFHGPGSKAIVWEHNSHLGDAAATEMGASGQTNVGHLCRTSFGDAAYLIGQGTDHGTVAAASNWDEPVEFMKVRPGYPGQLRESVPRVGRRGVLPAATQSAQSDRSRRVVDLAVGARDRRGLSAANRGGQPLLPCLAVAAV